MARKKVKTRQFEVPVYFIGAFFTELEKTDMPYSLVEIEHATDELIVEVDYSQDQREEIMNLIELLDEYNLPEAVRETEEEEEEEEETDEDN